MRMSKHDRRRPRLAPASALLSCLCKKVSKEAQPTVASPCGNPQSTNPGGGVLRQLALRAQTAKPVIPPPGLVDWRDRGRSGRAILVRAVARPSAARRGTSHQNHLLRLSPAHPNPSVVPSRPDVRQKKRFRCLSPAGASWRNRLPGVRAARVARRATKAGCVSLPTFLRVKKVGRPSGRNQRHHKIGTVFRLNTELMREVIQARTGIGRVSPRRATSFLARARKEAKKAPRLCRRLRRCPNEARCRRVVSRTRPAGSDRRSPCFRPRRLSIGATEGGAGVPFWWGRSPAERSDAGIVRLNLKEAAGWHAPNPSVVPSRPDVRQKKRFRCLSPAGASLRNRLPGVRAGRGARRATKSGMRLFAYFLARQESRSPFRAKPSTSQGTG